jgi:hypothetical protein
MTEPTEAELFADALEYRAMNEVFRRFDLGYSVTVERTVVQHITQPSLDKPYYLVKIRHLGEWEVESAGRDTLQAAAEEAMQLGLAKLEEFRK